MHKRRTSNTIVILQRRVVEIKRSVAVVIFRLMQSKTSVAVFIFEVVQSKGSIVFMVIEIKLNVAVVVFGYRLQKMRQPRDSNPAHRPPDATA
jgi:hypothetical protein